MVDPGISYAAWSGTGDSPGTLVVQWRPQHVFPEGVRLAIALHLGHDMRTGSKV